MISIRCWNVLAGRIFAVRRIAEAPISLAATICLSRVMKSFLSSGRSVSPATSSSIASLPPNQRPVTTEMHGAPAATYCGDDLGDRPLAHQLGAVAVLSA